jgi:hypothetical protein
MSWIASDWETSESRIRIALDQSFELQSLASSARWEVAGAIDEDDEHRSFGLVWFGVSRAGSDVKDFGDGFWRWRR